MSGTPDSLASTPKGLLQGLSAAQKLEKEYKSGIYSIQNIRHDLIEQERQSLKDHDSTNPPSSKSTQELSPSSSTEKSEEDQQDDKNSDSVVSRLINYGLKLSHKHRIKRRQETRKIDTHTPKITDAARKIERKESIEDLLLKKENEYRAHIEEMRREKEQEELSKLQKPKICRVSKSLSRPGSPYMRLYEQAKSKMKEDQEKKDKIDKLMEERENISSSPKINDASKHIMRGIDAKYQWEQDRIKKIEKLKKKMETDMKSDCVYQPQINSISRALALSMERDKSVEEHLLSLHKKKEMEKQKKIEEQKMKAIIESVPKINIHSANLSNRSYASKSSFLSQSESTSDPESSEMKSPSNQNKEKIFDRLYKVFTEKQLKTRIQQLEQTKEGNEPTDPSTGRRFHSPMINPRSSAIIRTKPIEEVLHDKGEEIRLKIEKMKEEMSTQQKKSEVKVNSLSQILNEFMESRSKTSSKERLLKSIHNIKESTKVLLQQNEKDLTFHPILNNNSLRINKKHTSSAPSSPIATPTGSPSASPSKQRNVGRIMDLLEKGEQYKKKVTEMQKELEKKQLSQCTFKPQTHSKNDENDQYARQKSDYASRSVAWLKKVQTEIEKQRKEKEERATEGCTFKPQTSRKPGASAKAGNNITKKPEIVQQTAQPIQAIKRPASSQGTVAAKKPENVQTTSASNVVPKRPESSQAGNRPITTVSASASLPSANVPKKLMGKAQKQDKKD